MFSFSLKKAISSLADQFRGSSTSDKSATDTAFDDTDVEMMAVTLSSFSRSMFGGDDGQTHGFDDEINPF